jgi:uncharacterized membrane protein
MSTGWLVGVMVEVADGAEPVRHFFAVGHAERAKAEWTAIDNAALIGPVAMSPVGGIEPVQAISAIPAMRMKSMGLAAGDVRGLGWKWPRGWVSR